MASVDKSALEFAQRYVKMKKRINESFTHDTDCADKLIDLMEERFALISQSFARQFFLFALTFYSGKTLSTLTRRERGIGWIASEVVVLVERIAAERENKSPWNSQFFAPPARDTLYTELMSAPKKVQDVFIELNEQFDSNPEAVMKQAKKIPSRNYAALEQFFYILYQCKVASSTTEGALCAMGSIFGQYDEGSCVQLASPRAFAPSSSRSPVLPLKAIGREALSKQQIRCALVASTVSKQGDDGFVPSQSIQSFSSCFAYMCVHWGIDPNDVSVDTKAHLLRSIDFLAGIPEFEDIVNTVSGHKNRNYTSAFMSYTAPELDKLDGDYSPEEKIKFFCAIADALCARDKKNGVVFTGDVYGLDSVVAVLRWEQFLPAVVNAYNGANARIDDVPMGLVLSTIDQSVFDPQLRDGDILMKAARKDSLKNSAINYAKDKWGYHGSCAISESKKAVRRFDFVLAWAKKVALGGFVETEFNRAIADSAHMWEPTESFIEAITDPNFSVFSPESPLCEKWEKDEGSRVFDFLDSWR